MQFITQSQAGTEAPGGSGTPATLTDSTNIASTPRGAAEAIPTTKETTAGAAQQKLSSLMGSQLQ